MISLCRSIYTHGIRAYSTSFKTPKNLPKEVTVTFALDILLNKKGEINSDYVKSKVVEQLRPHCPQRVTLNYAEKKDVYEMPKQDTSILMYYCLLNDLLSKPIRHTDYTYADSKNEDTSEVHDSTQSHHAIYDNTHASSFSNNSNSWGSDF